MLLHLTSTRPEDLLPACNAAAAERGSSLNHGCHKVQAHKGEPLRFVDSSLASAAGAFAQAVPLVANTVGSGAQASASAQAFAQSLTSAGIPQSIIAQACATVGSRRLMPAGGHA